MNSLRLLREAGLRVALDDFGTGYSSMRQLQRFKIDRLKIDQSFIASLGTGSEPAAIVQAIVSLGHAMGLQVTAEGIETQAQRDFLVGAGVDEMQGYFFARPADEKSLAALGGIRRPGGLGPPGPGGVQGQSPWPCRSPTILCLKHIFRSAARQHRGNPIQHRIGHAGTRFIRSAGDMRRQHDVFQTEIDRRHRGLAHENIEPCGTHVPVTQGRGQGLVIDQAAACGVDHHGTAWKRCNPLRVQPALRLRTRRRAQRQKCAM